MNYGFIYCLGNKAMPGIYKIGMTERAPAQRCAEISGVTAAPVPFDVLCFGQVEDPREIEAEIHGIFEPFRVNKSREFFEIDYSRVYDVISSYSNAVATTAEGAEESHRETLRMAFLDSKEPLQKLEALIDSARFEGIRFWREGDALKIRGELTVSNWMSGAIHVLRDDLLSLVPTEAPVSKLLARVQPDYQALAEELDW